MRAQLRSKVASEIRERLQANAANHRIGRGRARQVLWLATPNSRTQERTYETVIFQAVRYWLSNLALVRGDGTTLALPDAYYLMEVRDQQTLQGSSKELVLPATRRETVLSPIVPAGIYVGLQFQIGVDAQHNDDLSLSGGELTVMKNMASIQWMWFTSYIFTQLAAELAPPEGELEADGGIPPSTQLHWENGTNDDLRQVRRS